MKLLTHFPEILAYAESIAHNEVPVVADNLVYQSMIIMKVLCKQINELAYSGVLTEQKVLENGTFAEFILRGGASKPWIVMKRDAQAHEYKEYDEILPSVEYSPLSSMTV